MKSSSASSTAVSIARSLPWPWRRYFSAISRGMDSLRSSTFWHASTSSNSVHARSTASPMRLVCSIRAELTLICSASMSSLKNLRFSANRVSKEEKFRSTWSASASVKSGARVKSTTCPTDTRQRPSTPSLSTLRRSSAGGSLSPPEAAPQSLRPATRTSPTGRS